METARIEIGPVSESAYVDERGWIENIAFGEFRCVSLIFSKAGSVRSNHWHKTDSHVLYVVSGCCWYYERDLDGEYGPEPLVLKPGMSYYTGPRLVHRTVFPVDTVLISCSRNPRDHESHEADVVRVND